jgi:hypothetical protein
MASSQPVAVAIARRYFKRPQDQRLFLAQMRQESGFQDVTSPAGAQGPAQIMPSTAKAWRVRNVHDPADAYSAAAEHMRAYLAAYGGSWSKALTAYNAGPGAVGKPLPAETSNYLKTILGGQGMASTGGSGSAAAALPGSSVNLGLKSSFDQAGYAKAQKLAFLSSYLERNHAMGSLFRTGVLSTAAPDPQAFTDSQLTSKLIPGGAAPHTVQSGGGVAAFDGKHVASWIAPILDYARQKGWKGSVTSGYRSVAEQARIYNSGVRPAAKPGQSNHNFTAFPGGAVDVSDAQTLAQILARSPYRKKLVWAGGKDPVHFSHPHSGGY